MQTPDGVFRFTSVNDCYASLMGVVMSTGEDVKPRGELTREIRSATIQIHNPNDNVLFSPARKPNYSFMVAEWLWIMTGCALRDAIVPFNKNLDMAADQMSSPDFDSEALHQTFAGAYGPKWIEQMPYILDTLSNDPESRQAVVNIWRDRPRHSKDQPCTLNWQFFIRNDKLEMHTHMRSNDLWLGTPYDLFNFTQIQRWVAYALGKNVGPYYHHVGSLHIYERNFEGAEKVILEGRSTSFSTRVQMFHPPKLSRLLNLLLEAAMWRESSNTRWLPGHIHPWISRMSTESDDASFWLFPALLHASSPAGKQFFMDNGSTLMSMAKNTAWERVVESLTGVDS